MADSQALGDAEDRTELESGKRVKLQGDEEKIEEPMSSTTGEDVAERETKTESLVAVNPAAQASTEVEVDDKNDKEEEGMAETEHVKDKPPPHSASPHLYCEEWSKLSREKIIDCIKGMIFGQAIGDALGESHTINLAN